MQHFGNDNAPTHLDLAQTRANAIRAQLELAVSFCNLVATELKYGHTDDAHRLIQKAQRVAETADKHIREGAHVPPEEVPILKEQLRNLELLIGESQRKLAASDSI